MTEREEIINSLNACMDVHRSGLWSSGCAFCSYAKQSDPKCFMDLTKDAIALLKHDDETINSLQSTINKLTKALAEKPEQKFFVDRDGKMIPLPIQKHGHWIMPRKFFLETQCSACKETYVGDYRTFNYCPNCGAIMDEKVVECRCK